MYTRSNAQNENEDKKQYVAWRYCTKCGTSYPATQVICYTCYRRANSKQTTNLLNSEFAKTLVTKCGESYPKNFIRLNVDIPLSESTKKYLNGCGNCFECTEKAFCNNFGNPFYICSKQDWEYCKCKNCCAVFRKSMQKQKVE